MVCTSEYQQFDAVRTLNDADQKMSAFNASISVERLIAATLPFFGKARP